MMSVWGFPQPHISKQHNMRWEQTSDNSSIGTLVVLWNCFVRSPKVKVIHDNFMVVGCIVEICRMNRISWCMQIRPLRFRKRVHSKLFQKIIRRCCQPLLFYVCSDTCHKSFASHICPAGSAMVYNTRNQVQLPCSKWMLHTNTLDLCTIRSSLMQYSSTVAPYSWFSLGSSHSSCLRS